jgi:hypothetical protein
VPTIPASKRTSKPRSDLDAHNALVHHNDCVGRSGDGGTEFDRERRGVGTTGTGMDLEGRHHSPRLDRKSFHLAPIALRAAIEYRSGTVGESPLLLRPEFHRLDTSTRPSVSEG